jgi:predicted short-subunit dehydrogenase-like oxidoreductase (DUF2520 family)
LSEQVVIVGPGRMGLALGAALREVRAVDRLIFVGRGYEPPPHPLFEPPPDPDDAPVEYRLGPGPVPAGTTILVLAVPDAAVAEVAYDLAAAGPAPAGCAALHLSGAVSTDVLAPLHGAGYAVGSMHPLQSVADPWISGDRLIGAVFSVAGEPAALNAARRLVSELAGEAIVVPHAQRVQYHAAAVFASNYLVALLTAATRLMVEAGVEEDAGLRALIALARGTLDNVAQIGPRAALTGPIARGDVDTIRMHLTRLSAEDGSLYSALGREALRLARAAGLDERRAEELERLLSEG